MAQKQVWDREYQNPQLVTLGEDARKDVRDTLKDLRRKHGVALETLRVLDLGCGVGPNALYLAEYGATVTGMDISPTAIEIAKVRAREAGFLTQCSVHNRMQFETHKRGNASRTDSTVSVSESSATMKCADCARCIDYRIGNMGAALPFPEHSFDLILDIMASNSLTEAEREIHLKEMHRVLSPGGYLIYRGLCKDGDSNAKNLIKMFPGAERDTYVMPKLGLTERVFSETDFRTLYTPYFNIISLEKKSNYAHFDGKSYKRNYFVGLLQKA